MVLVVFPIDEVLLVSVDAEPCSVDILYNPAYIS